MAAALPDSTGTDTLGRATDLMWRHGYRAISVDDLVRETGLNRHTLYTRYGSKLGLLRAALERYVAETVLHLEKAFALPGSPRQRLEHFLSLRHPAIPHPFWARMLRRGCFAFRTIAELGEEHPDLVSIGARIPASLRSGLLALVEEGQRAGDFRRDREARDLAEVLAAGFVSPLVLPASEDHARALLAVVS